MAKDADVSRFMSLVLRHAPEQGGLTLDSNGWTDFATLCGVLSERFGVSAADVRRIVEQSPKKRFVLDGDRIRAAQGHSVKVDLGLAPVAPPDRLFHGTKLDSLPTILVEGLTKQARQHVHLSPDIETARVVADRRPGKSVILIVDTTAMQATGMTFFLSENGVWLTDAVPSQYLTVKDD
ncbi:RNA 2'-phosphotransferase [Mangrovicella endophytica]|uniref:RNA 2'-phosphotransferase n=1 Tax=Mangrovicella endophytica TaxID=2066697 RepID=UPI000C9E7A58|nr:RNA 2'-phosphotransferase [Mangrovicella endophytica]